MRYTDRLNFYLGTNFINKNFDNINFKNMRRVKDLTNKNPRYQKSFINKLKETNNHNKRFKIAFGDITKKKDVITLCKNRCAENTDSVILRCLNYKRHWHYYYNKPKETQFKNKINKVFWRGSSTGKESMIANRFELVRRWCDKDSDIDVGFSEIVQRRAKQLELNNYVKGKSNIATFLKYKYILSVQGNDKDSGLQWKLNSNSVVLMAKPTVTTWLMETTLVPGVHYVLLDDDFGNLKKQLIWCNNNQNKCKKIIKNANNFMKQFENVKEEEKLETDVLNKYFKILNNKLINKQTN